MRAIMIKLWRFLARINPLDQRLNIRQKLIGVFIGFALAAGVLGLVSYYNLYRVEEKVQVVEAADDISNMILEIRRHEKNYFLYASDKDYEETLQFIERTFQLMDVARPSITKLKLNSRLDAIRNELNNYRALLERVAAVNDSSAASDVIARELLILDLRDSGQALVNLSKSLVAYERGQILRINSRLKNNILVILVLFAAISILLIIFIQRKVIRPLGAIVQATKSIADGKFERARVWNTRDEIQKVMLAFNKMVDELERRQDQLVEAQKLSAIGTLASGIAHQVNNPLNNIATSCQILMEDFGEGCSELALKMLNNIEKETFRARDIVRGLLEFSRNQESVLAENRLLEVVERSIKLMASPIPSGIEVFNRVPEEITFQMDRQRMQELFLNLMLNAVHAIEPDSGKIFITAVPEPKEGKVIISVEDSGKGIPAEIRSRIFDPFFTTKAEGRGTGLGLYIVYNIVQKHSGSIRVEDLISGGSRFVIEIPARQQAPASGTS